MIDLKIVLKVVLNIVKMRLDFGKFLDFASLDVIMYPVKRSGGLVVNDKDTVRSYEGCHCQ